MKDTINLALVQQLRVLRLDRLQLDSHLFSCGHIGAQVDIAKRPATNLPPEAVFLSYPQLHGVGLLSLTSQLQVLLFVERSNGKCLVVTERDFVNDVGV